jgi:hypothetical protein
MAEYVTSILEITELGTPIRTEGEHVVRVLGALKQVQVAAASGTKEDQAAIDTSDLAKYLAGDLQPPPADAGAPEEDFQVPEALVLAGGNIGFLKRGGTA